MGSYKSTCDFRYPDGVMTAGLYGLPRQQQPEADQEPNCLNPRELPAGHQDRWTKKAAGHSTKLPVWWQWTGRYFEH